MSNRSNLDDNNQELELYQSDDQGNGGDQLIPSQRTQSKYLNSNNLKNACVVILLIIIVISIVAIKGQISQSISQNQNSNQETVEWIDIKETIVHKEEDQANYEYIVIPENNLKVLLITQKNLKLSGASLDVRVGSQNNPKEFQGLAHLLEHMLFMGSQKYPQEDAFGSLVSKSGKFKFHDQYLFQNYIL